jgi:hypothetical protein
VPKIPKLRPAGENRRVFFVENCDLRKSPRPVSVFFDKNGKRLRPGHRLARLKLRDMVVSKKKLTSKEFCERLLAGRKVRVPGTSEYWTPTIDDAKWAAERLLPYQHRKMPQQHEVDASVNITLQQLLNEVAGSTLGRLPGELIDVSPEAVVVHEPGNVALSALLLEGGVKQ